MDTRVDLSGTGESEQDVGCVLDAAIEDVAAGGGVEGVDHYVEIDNKRVSGLA